MRGRFIPRKTDKEHRPHLVAALAGFASATVILSAGFSTKPKADPQLPTSPPPNLGEEFDSKNLSKAPDPKPKVRIQSFWLIIAGLLICAGNMTAAWFLIHSSTRFIMTGLVSDHVKTATGEALTVATKADWEKLVFLDRVIENDVNHRNIANKQTTVMASMAISFALIGLGFSLFVMGI